MRYLIYMAQSTYPQFVITTLSSMKNAEWEVHSRNCNHVKMGKVEPLFCVKTAPNATIAAMVWLSDMEPEQGWTMEHMFIMPCAENI